MPSQLTPLANNLLLKPAQPVGKSGGGIIIPEAHQTRLNSGEVLEKGYLCTDKISVGDVVFYGAHSESILKFGEHTFVVVAEENCLGKIVPSKEEPKKEEKKVEEKPLALAKNQCIAHTLPEIAGRELR